MSRRTIILWNLGRLFGSSGSPIEAALNSDSVNARSTADDVELKVEIIARAIDEIAARHEAPPILVGCIEIENAELCLKIASRIRSADMLSIDPNTTDESGYALDGLNIGLLHSADIEAVRLRSHVIDRTFDTRDVLEADLTIDGRRISALVNHWPSRMSSEGLAKRVTAAHYVRRLAEGKLRFSLDEMWQPESGTLVPPSNSDAKERAKTPVVVMGDFNDEVFDQSLAILNSTQDRQSIGSERVIWGRSNRQRFRNYINSPPVLYNPFWNILNQDISGSYYRSPRWRTYDQILLSEGFMGDNSGFKFINETQSVNSDLQVVLQDGTPWSLVNGGGKPVPFDAKKGRGCSDHFPVSIVVDL